MVQYQHRSPLLGGLQSGARARPAEAHDDNVYISIPTLVFLLR
jgi:hypothetical protein